MDAEFVERGGEKYIISTHQWEYIQKPSRGRLDQVLTEMGLDHWEHYWTHSYSSGGDLQLYFKRKRWMPYKPQYSD